jgi:hypothetical protein
MGLRIAALVASFGLLFACASPDDDSWEGAAGDEVGDNEGAGGTTSSGGSTKASSGGNSVASSSVASSSNVASSTAVSSTVVSSSSGGTCDSGNCDTCQQCALNGPCSGAVNACFADPECYALIECLQDCFDDACFNACASAHSAGLPLYDAVGICVICDQCSLSCGGC